LLKAGVSEEYGALVIGIELLADLAQALAAA
jgi:hypothetical protein